MSFRWGARPPDRVRSVIAVGTVVVSCALGLVVAASAHAAPGDEMTVVSVGGVTVKGNAATAVGTSKIGKLKQVTQTVPLVRERGKWKVCPKPEAEGVGPQDHIEPPVTVPPDYIYDPGCVHALG